MLRMSTCIIQFPSGRSGMGTTVREVAFSTGEGSLRGELTVPATADTVVLLLSGDCGAGQTPQESTLGRRLAERGIGTFAVDLLTATEASARENRQDIELLGRRIDALYSWLGRQERLDTLDIAVYAADTAAPAAVQYVDSADSEPVAVALRNGRLDLLDGAPSALEIPVLVVCAKRNSFLRDVNQAAYDSLSAESQRAEFLAVDGRLDGERIATWFEQQLTADRSPQHAD
jgi:putative phosphoribosyl transferase